MEDNCVDLIITSPPFALQRKKEYGNKDQDEYVDWLIEFGNDVFRVLKESGSFVLDLGGAYKKGRPVRSLYNFRVLLRMCDECGFNLAEEFFWHNPAKLPSPIEWVNKRKIRAKDSVNTVWWLSKTDFPKANIKKVLVPYSDRMKKLLKDPERFYTAKKRPSGHNISMGFGTGSNTTGEVAENKARQWIACDLDKDYLAASALRFFEEPINEKQKDLFSIISNNPSLPVDLTTIKRQQKLFA